MNINKNYLNVKQSYLFSEIAARIDEHVKNNPEKSIIKMGIGDVTLPLCTAVSTAMEEASREMGTAGGFHGYGPEQGYPFLREAVREYYAQRGVELAVNEIFISDGAKSDLGNILDLFSAENTVLVPDPVYPVYVDTNIMDGRKIEFLNANEKNGFLPMPGAVTRGDIIYLCSPNNPTGAAYDRAGLKAWVDFANERKAIILFDAAYEAFVTEKDLPRSIFEIPGAKTCAIEFCSFSKTAGFTGTRCGYTVVPEALMRQCVKLNPLWLRRQTTKFNGVSYVVQKGAAAVFSPEGMSQVKENIAHYLENARIITSALNEAGVWYTGGVNSPYVWMKCPGASWDFFDLLLNRAGVVGTPGAGFGKNGEGFFRLTAFSTKENTEEAMRRIKKVL